MTWNGELTDDEGITDTSVTFWSVALYFRTRRYGGPEEGGWWYDQDVLVAAYDTAVRDPDLINNCMGIVTSEREAYEQAATLNKILDDGLNKDRPPLDSVLSTGRYVACVHPGWPPAFDPAERPFYE